MVRLPTKPEVLAIEEAHRAAQARLGIAGAYLVIRDWEGVSATAAVATSSEWLTRSLQMIRAIQRKSTRLAKAYYQLARAIETGYTMGLPETSSDPEQVTMGDLRQQYRELLLDIADIDKPRAAGDTPPEDSDERWLEEELQAVSGEIVGTDEGSTVDFSTTDMDDYIEDWLEAADDDDASQVEVDEFEWPDSKLTLADVREAFSRQIQEAAEERAEKIARIQKDEELSAKKAFKLTHSLHQAAGTISAGIVDDAGIDAGRQTIEYAQSRDRRVKMVARGTGPNPCAFCAMLASRGFVYANATTAGEISASLVYGEDARGTINRYHPNCHCYPVVRWADIPDPTAPGRSEEYTALWEQMKEEGVEERGTKNDMLNDFRRRLNAKYRAERLRQTQSA